jgi:hypothetical protein
MGGEGISIRDVLEYALADRDGGGLRSEWNLVLAGIWRLSLLGMRGVLVAFALAFRYPMLFLTIHCFVPSCLVVSLAAWIVMAILIHNRHASALRLRYPWDET